MVSLWYVGDRSRLKMLAREMDDVDVRDNVGNTPLMYTVMGRQPKVLCLVAIPVHAYVYTQTMYLYSQMAYKIYLSLVLSLTFIHFKMAM